MTASGARTPDGAGVPPFAVLFPVCYCGRAKCSRCCTWQLTPRTALALWAAAQLTADDGYEDVAEHGDAAVLAVEDWALFDQYPTITYRQDANWRRRAARAYDDLAADLAAGRRPEPRCPAEEMALHVLLGRLADWCADDPGMVGRPEELADLPAHPDDLDWDSALDALFADHDILMLFDPERDGIEDPDSAENLDARIGDYRPIAWFTAFIPEGARDPHRGFRR